MCLELLLQPQEDACEHDLEGDNGEWDTAFVKVAEIIVPAQDFMLNEQHQTCAMESFDIWDGLEDHRPLGRVNRLRKDA